MKFSSFIARNVVEDHVYASVQVTPDMVAYVNATAPKVPRSYKNNTFVNLDVNASTAQQVGRMLANKNLWTLVSQSVLPNGIGRNYILRDNEKFTEVLVRFALNTKSGHWACNAAQMIKTGQFEDGQYRYRLQNLSICQRVFDVVNPNRTIAPLFAPSWYHLLALHLAGVKVNYGEQSAEHVTRGYQKGLWERNVGGWYPLHLSDVRKVSNHLASAYDK